MWLHRFAIFTAVATLPLIFIGGLVTSHHAALAVPDWPTTYGYNMFLFPWRKMVGGIFYEHSHRLVASLVGVLTIILAVWLQLAESRVWVKRLGWFALGLVIIQGILGGLRVILLQKGIAIFHACLAQSFFCLVTSIALFTSNWWKNQLVISQKRDEGFLRKWTLLVTIFIFIQLILGATMRHTDSGLAVPDFPLVYGKILPPFDATALAQANEARIWQWGLDPITFFQIAIHLIHRLWAMVVALGVIAILRVIWRYHRDEKIFKIPALLLGSLLAGQIMLGISVIWTSKAADIATAHVAVGALMLVTSFLFTLISFKVLTPINQFSSVPIITSEKVPA